ncbi:competence protein ComEA [Catenisphaera adipataccumulans]|uniref:Competence protein ComEA n=1 Tax=Catenisphaera adipataccumulans TaxID=700500 RepID=A0A7W8FV24_9FIRM|nr:competence protein ComEA [Catenisphaera adipataccumulans]
MKRILLCFFILVFFLATYYGRYQPVSLDLVQPTVKQVEIKGAVKKPGVYTVKWEATVRDVIKAAGGTSADADTGTVSMVKEVNDHDVIVIPEKEATPQTKVSINSATLEQLDALPGIGPALAQRIIDYREQTPFQSIEDIQNVKGIGEVMYAKIKDQITL